MLFLFQLIGEFVAAPATCRRRVRSTTAQLKLPLPSTSQAATHTAPDLGTKQHDVALKLHVEGRTCMRVTRFNDSDYDGDTSQRASAIRGTCPRRQGRHTNTTAFLFRSLGQDGARGEHLVQIDVTERRPVNGSTSSNRKCA